MMKQWMILLSVLMVLAALPLAAQTQRTGVIAGVIQEVDGAVIPGASVFSSQADGSYPQEVTADAAGRFRVGFLPPGLYNLVVSADGFIPQQIVDIRVRAESTSEVLLTLDRSPEVIEEAIIVTSETPLIDATTTELSSSLPAEEIELLPTDRVATGIINFVPGARENQVWGGSTEQANLYQLDGVQVNQPGFGGDFLLPNPDWLEEIQVKGLGAGAEYGNFQGGVVNMVTKSGTNTLRGGVYLNYEGKDLTSSNLNVEEAGEEVDTRWEANANLSGAFIKDKLYYFGSIGQVRIDTDIVDAEASVDEVVFLPVQEERVETKAIGKLNWNLTDRDSLNFVLGWDDVESDPRGLNSFTAPEAGQRQESPSIFYSASWTRPVSSANFLEVKLTGYDGEDNRFPLGGETIPAVQILGGNRDLFTNAVNTRERSLDNLGLVANWDGFFETGSISHQLKAGGEYDTGSWLEQRRRNGNLTWRPEEGDVPFDANDPATWGFISSDWGGLINLDAEIESASLYVQDYMDISSRVRLGVGLRYGRWEGLLSPGFGGGGQFTAVDDSAIDPRIGVTVDFTGDGRWIGKAHWGRYHQSLFALMFDRVEGGNVFTDEEYWDWIADDLPELGRAYSLAERDQYFELFDINPIGQEVGPAENYSQPFVDQAVLSLEYALGSSWRLGATYVRRDWEDIVALVDKNLATNYTLYRNVEVIDFNSGEPVLDQFGNPLVLSDLYIGNGEIIDRGSAPGLSDEDIANLTFDPQFVLTNPADAFRAMDQVQLVADYRASSWRVNSSLVYTDLQGNFYSVSGYEDPGGTGAGAFVERNLQTNFEGWMPNASEWELKARVSGDLPWKLRGGAYLLYALGDRYTPVYEIDNQLHDFYTADGEYINFRLLNGVNGQTIFLEPRGDREFDDFPTLDLHLDRPFAMGGGELIAGIDVFNLFNSDAVTDVRRLVNDQDPADPTTLFGSTRLRQAPRTIRLNLGFRW